MFDDLLSSDGSNSGSEEQEKDVKQVLEVLSTNVEGINQRLSGTNMDDSFNKTMKEFLPKVNKSLNQLQEETSQVKKTVSDMNNRFYKLEQNIENRMNQFEEKLDEQRRDIDEAIENINTTQNLTKKAITESNQKFKQKLQQMIDIHMEEIQLLRDQNETFVNHMEKLEDNLEFLDSD